jgi:hypothetical protein
MRLTRAQSGRARGAAQGDGSKDKGELVLLTDRSNSQAMHVSPPLTE